MLLLYGCNCTIGVTILKPFYELLIILSSGVVVPLFSNVRDAKVVLMSELIYGVCATIIDGVCYPSTAPPYEKSGFY